MKSTIKEAHADYQLGKFKTFEEALEYHHKLDSLITEGMEKLSRDEMKNITCSEQGRSLAKKNLELEYFLTAPKRLFFWMFYNLHWVILVGCVALALIAWWGLSTEVLR